MNSQYRFYFQLIEILNAKPELVATPQLYSYDLTEIYRDTLNNLALPLEDGSESPFSANNPFSAEGVLIAQILNLLYYAVWREANLIPEKLLFDWFKVLGLTVEATESPVVELRFTRTTTAINSGVTSIIPLGLQIRSSFNSDRIVVVQEETEVTGSEVLVSAKLNQTGRLVEPIRANEFVLLPLGLQDFESVVNTRILSQGSNPTTIEEMIERGINLLNQPGQRVITARDYVNAALNAGATQATLLPNLAIGDDDSVSYQEVLSLVTYPLGINEVVRAQLIDLVPAGTNLEVISAKVIPLDGEISVRFDPSLTQVRAFDLLATRIQQAVNPPYGIFGDLDFNSTLTVALEQVRGILAVPYLALKHTETGVLLSDFTILPHYLLEIQSSLSITYL